jgi:hypothetical protein
MKNGKIKWAHDGRKICSKFLKVFELDSTSSGQNLVTENCEKNNAGVHKFQESGGPGD